jgi:hypothetical protein
MQQKTVRLGSILWPARMDCNRWRFDDFGESFRAPREPFGGRRVIVGVVPDRLFWMRPGVSFLAMRGEGGDDGVEIPASIIDAHSKHLPS